VPIAVSEPFLRLLGIGEHRNALQKLVGGVDLLGDLGFLLAVAAVTSLLEVGAEGAVLRLHGGNENIVKPLAHSGGVALVEERQAPRFVFVAFLLRNVGVGEAEDYVFAIVALVEDEQCAVGKLVGGRGFRQVVCEVGYGQGAADEAGLGWLVPVAGFVVVHVLEHEAGGLAVHVELG